VTLQFRFILQPPAPVIESLAACDAINPLHTLEYVNAHESLGARPCLLGLYRDDELVSGCIGYLSGSFLRRNLHIRSLPQFSDPASFWQGVLESCRTRGIWRMQIDTYASPGALIPQLPGELERRVRWEYVLDLGREDFRDGIGSQHRRSISRARKAGLSIRRTREASAFLKHLELMEASTERRVNRGEKTDSRQDSARPLALLASRSGEIFQAVSGEEVLSSMLVLRSTRGAYYQSAGTSPEGMKLGASPFLVSQVAEILKKEGVQVFYLGGAGEESPGLRRFKAGFGAQEVELQAASFCPKPAFQRKLHGALRSCWSWAGH
jgi:lipid II:glycine glycyltransferase (peptidoglycan interpeptide bridge formation enzyme)